MAEFLDKTIGFLKLENQAGVKCYLECYWRIGKNGEPQRSGKSGSILLGQSETLDLRSLDLNEDSEIWVTAYANVSAGDDSSGNVWLRYDANSENTATFKITGTAITTTTTFDRISTGDEYFDTHITKITLNNQSGTVCSLECYYKKGKGGTPKRIGETSTIPVGQSVSLNLLSIDELKNQVNSDEIIWVTAYANVSAGKDCFGSSWFPFQKISLTTEAVFTIVGVINFTEVVFDKVFKPVDGILKGYAIQCDAPFSYLDHTYVHVCDMEENVQIRYGCWGRDDGGNVICDNTANVSIAERIATDNGRAGIIYLITGVCHQTANRILYPAGITVYNANGYAISSAIYGTYGKGGGFVPIAQPSNCDSYFGELQEVYRKYADLSNEPNIFIERTTEELMLLAKYKLGKNRNLNKEAIHKIVTYAASEHSKLVSQENISEEHLKVQLNELANRIAEQFTTIMSDEEYYGFIGVQKGKQIVIA